MELLPLLGFGFVIGWPIGALAGFLIPVRRRWLAVPAFGLAIGWFVLAGWYGDNADSDLGKTGGIILAVLMIGGIYLGFIAALGPGQRLRRRFSERRRAGRGSPREQA